MQNLLHIYQSTKLTTAESVLIIFVNHEGILRNAEVGSSVFGIFSE